MEEDGYWSRNDRLNGFIGEPRKGTNLDRPAESSSFGAGEGDLMSKEAKILDIAMKSVF